MTKKEEPKAEEKKEEEVEKSDTPKWAMELGAKFDKMTDAFSKVAEGLSAKQEEEEKPEEEEKQAEEEEEKPKEEEKQAEEEEEKPKEEEKQEEEEDKPEEEEKVSKEDVAKMVADGIKKALSIVEEKKSKVPTELSKVLDYNAIRKLSWAEVNAEAQKRGAR